jgi:hypothetical protein
MAVAEDLSDAERQVWDASGTLPADRSSAATTFQIGAL